MISNFLLPYITYYLLLITYDLNITQWKNKVNNPNISINFVVTAILQLELIMTKFYNYVFIQLYRVLRKIPCICACTS